MKITVNEPPPAVVPPKTYLLEISREEMDLLRYFADATGTCRSVARAARRFLDKTLEYYSNTYAPSECFL